MKNLDGTDRKLKVIQLHGLDASLVAGTLRGLLAGDDQSKADNNNSNSSDHFGPFGFGPRRGRGFGWSGPTPTPAKEETSTGKFRVDADAANNRLILWANKIEIEQVEACLTELGEIAPRERGRESVRFLDLGNGGEEQRFLERLRLVWPALSKEGSKLIIDVPSKQPDEDGTTRSRRTSIGRDPQRGDCSQGILPARTGSSPILRRRQRPPCPRLRSHSSQRSRRKDRTANSVDRDAANCRGRRTGS